MKTTMNILRAFILLAATIALQAQQVTISDTLTNTPGGDAWTGTIVVRLNSPSYAYYGTTSLSGWQYVLCVGGNWGECSAQTAAGVITIPLYATTTMTPSGLSYSATYAPRKGSRPPETWTVSPSHTKLYEIRSSPVPTPTVTFSPTQLSSGGATTGQCLIYDGNTWEGATCASGSGSGTVTSVAATVPSILSVAGSPITSSGTLALSLATQSANQVFAGPTTGASATPTFRTLVDADIPNTITIDLAATATALATPRAINGTNFDGTAPITITANLPANPTACASGEYVSDIAADGTLTCSTPAGGGSGTVTSVSVTTANGVSGSVANATTTPAITLTLGAITPSSVAAVGTVTGSNLSGTNTGDQTTITGNAGTATALAANGANCSAGQFPLGVDASGAAETCTALPTTITGTANQITASASTGAVTLSIPNNPTLPGTTTGTFSGNLTGNVTGNASTATALAANPTACTSGQYVSDIAADGTLTCSAPSGGGATVRTTYASLPTCDSSKTNYHYLLTDSIYTANCNGTAFAYWAGQKYIPTLPWSNGTTFGTGATVTATTGSVLFDGGSPAGGDAIRAAIKAIPTAPYTIILDIDMLEAGAVGSSSCGLVITNGTTAASSDVITLMQSYVGLNMTKLTSATVWDSNYIAYAQATSRNKMSFRLVDDNTNRTWSVSQDRINWTQVSQQSRTDFLTATHYGYGCNMTGVSGIVTMVIEGLYAQ